MQKQPIEVPGATLGFITYEKDGFIYYEFDSSMCLPPDPMINVMSGLKLLDSSNKRLIMINMKLPIALFPKIEDYFSWKSEKFENGNVKLTFKLKNDQAIRTDFSDTECDG